MAGMEEKEGAMRWKKYFGIKGIDWESDVGYAVNAEEES
eukprot:gene18151-38723_t